MPKVTRRKEIVTIRVEINETETKKVKEKYVRQKVVSLKYKQN